MKRIIWYVLIVMMLAVSLSACSSTSTPTSTTVTASKSQLKAERKAYHKCMITHGVVFPKKSTSTQSSLPIASGTSSTLPDSLKALRTTPTYIAANNACKYLKPKKTK